MDFVQRMLLTALLAGFAHLPWCFSQYYYIINDFKNWTEAQDYCRKYYYDLASFDNKEQHDQLVKTLVSRGYTDGVWIGLYDDRYSWRWSYGEKIMTYTNWALNEPDSYKSKEACSIFYKKGDWGDMDCEDPLNFLCYNATTNTTVLIQEWKSWSAALIYCRLYHTDLAIIENQEENKKVKLLLIDQNVDFVYMGSYRDTWKWSDQSSYVFKAWMPTEPNNVNGAEYCGELSLLNAQWRDMKCSLKLRYVCGTAKKIQILRINIQSPLNLNDNAILLQLQQNLGKQGPLSNMKLKWRTQPDGQIFHIVNTANVTNKKQFQTVT